MPLAFVEPAPAAGAQLVEGAPGDELQCGDEVLVASVATAGLGAKVQPLEEVCVEEQPVVDLVDVHASLEGGWRLVRVGQVWVSGGGVRAEPVAHDIGVVAGLARRDPERVADLVAGDAVAPA